MSYAIRNDLQGWRAVEGPGDVGPDEYYSESPIEVLPPAPTYQSELADLNRSYQSDIEGFKQAFSLAYLADGPSQDAKQAAIRAQYEARKSLHAANVAALKAKYSTGV